MIRRTIRTVPSQESRVVTIPNVLSLIRLACIPLFCWLLFGRDDVLNSGFLLAGLGASDWVDGYIARRFNQVSDLGKVLDPLADRLLFIVCGGAVVLYGAAPTWFSVLVVIREALLGVALVVLTALGMKRFDVSKKGKLATFLLMFAFPFFLLYRAQVGTWSTIGHIGAWATGLPGLILSWYTAITYVPTMRHALAEGRAERQSPARQAG